MLIGIWEKMTPYSIIGSINYLAKLDVDTPLKIRKIGLHYALATPLLGVDLKNSRFRDTLCQTVKWRGLKDGPMVENCCCSCRGQEFRSQHPYQAAYNCQEFQFLGDPELPSGLHTSIHSYISTYMHK